jgi:hypothetical protein
MITTKNFLEDCMLEWGIPASKINKAYKESLYEAKHFNKQNDIEYIKETMSIILDRQDKLFLDSFMKCGHYNLKEFIDSLYDDKITETIESTDFASDQKPEKSGHKYYTNGMDDVLVDDNQEENNKEANL